MLTTQQFINLLPIEWHEFLKNEFNKPYFENILKNINYAIENNILYPSLKKIFRIYNEVNLKDVRVLILGQDPYHGPGQANGFSFSVEKYTKTPPSLKNVFKEINADLNIKNKNGDLSPWVNQGVFLLNSILTVESGKANSHQKIGWEKFTDLTIELISKHNNNVVFLLWGKKAQEKEHLIIKEKHLILKTTHPSPLSSYRGFLGCKHFSKANHYLKKTHGITINWTT
jgi:uracil-DNA glycosylase